jgi:hypothetical protein
LEWVVKFTYEQKDKTPRKPVAVIMPFDDGPALCMAFEADGGKFVWFYPDGEVSVQSTPFDLVSAEKIFYEGDSVTITF